MLSASKIKQNTKQVSKPADKQYSNIEEDENKTLYGSS
jgi:hypothetical protein